MRKKIGTISESKQCMLFLCLLSFSLTAQNVATQPAKIIQNPYYRPVNNGWVLDSILGYNAKGTQGTATYYQHDKQGRCIDEQHFINYMGWTGYSRSHDEFDDKGNTVLTISYNWDNVTKEWIPQSKYGYKYDPDNSFLQLENEAFVWVEGSWFGQSKTERMYEGENTIGYIQYQWGTTGWTPAFKSVYDAAGSVNSQWNQTTQTWDVQSRSRKIDLKDGPAGFVCWQDEEWQLLNPVWKPTYRNYYQYDTHNNVTRMIIEKYDTSTGEGRWITTQSRVATFNGSGKPTYQLDSVFNQFTGKLEPMSKQIMEYDARNNVTLQEQYSYSTTAGESGAWFGSFKLVKAYDAQDRVINYEYYSWDYNGGWLGSSKYQESFNAEGLVASRTNYQWSYMEPIGWQPGSRESLFYNNAKLDTLTTTEQWDAVNQTWLRYRNEFSLYNASFDRLSGHTFQWNQAQSMWKEMQRDTARYDEHHNMVFDERFEWDSKTQKLVSKGYRNYYYSELNAGSETRLENTPASGLSCWTEKGRLHLFNNQDSGLVRVFALDGRMVFNTWLSKGDVSLELPEGIYLVTWGTKRIKIMVP